MIQTNPFLAPVLIEQRNLADVRFASAIEQRDEYDHENRADRSRDPEPAVIIFVDENER